MSDTLLVSTRKGLFTVRRGAKGWAVDRASFLGDNVTLAMADPRDGAWYAALDHGHFGVKLHRSGDQGATWEEIAVPVYPEPPEGHEEKDWMGRAIPWKLIRVWALEPGGADQPGRLWCGTLPGGLFWSEDRGASWTLVRSLWDDPRRQQWSGGGADFAGLHSICVDPKDSRRVTIAVSTGGVWQTADLGASWTLVGQGLRAEYMPPEQAHDPLQQDVHRLVQCPAAPEAFWLQHHNGVFRSTDGAATFEEITTVPPAVFGFAVAVHPKDPRTAWFVPAQKDEKRIPVEGKVVVARTRDGAKTFEVLRAGLPQDHAYDLTLRHALAIDGTGDRLAFGSTTGSLWVTEDGGDRWQTVSEHLPPVYAVRFA
ncbi:MAG TPA: hypothetical protein VFT46_11300 [Holophagaceae bacterium]|nr:hypothetical protein [Holophagaceae bacterium]